MFIRRLCTISAVLILSACAVSDPLETEMVDLGDFRLKWTIVVAKDPQVVPPSRTATEEEWKEVLGGEIDRRFRRYEGTRDYHLAVNVDGYALAVPGIPVVLAPKSVLVVSANIWDHEKAKKIHLEPEQLTVFEGASAETIIGSGLTKSREQQMETLARNAAFKIEAWLLENREWFDPKTSDAAKE